MFGKASWSGVGRVAALVFFALSQGKRGLAMTLADLGFLQGGTSWGLGKLVFLEKEKQLLEHECRKEVLFPTANPQDISIIQSRELL